MSFSAVETSYSLSSFRESSLNSSTRSRKITSFTSSIVFQYFESLPENSSFSEPADAFVDSIILFAWMYKYLAMRAARQKYRGDRRHNGNTPRSHHLDRQIPGFQKNQVLEEQIVFTVLSAVRALGEDLQRKCVVAVSSDCDVRCVHHISVDLGQNL